MPRIILHGAVGDDLVYLDIDGEGYKLIGDHAREAAEVLRNIETEAMAARLLLDENGNADDTGMLADWVFVEYRKARSANEKGEKP